MSEIPKAIGLEKIVFSGQIIEVVEQQMQSVTEIKTFEKARRSPGTRLIIINQEKKQILLTKEYRFELNNFDYRLPGGKVCDSLTEFNEIKKENNIENTAKKAAIIESQQEAGVTPENMTLFAISKSGGPTIEWDLYYFLVDKFTETNQDLEFGENITIEWLDYKEAIDLCLSGKMKEDRSVGVLMKFFRSKNII
jgi:ADP-ribose pyrophosphatase